MKPFQVTDCSDDCQFLEDITWPRGDTKFLFEKINYSQRSFNDLFAM